MKLYYESLSVTTTSREMTPSIQHFILVQAERLQIITYLLGSVTAKQHFYCKFTVFPSPFNRLSHLPAARSAFWVTRKTSQLRGGGGGVSEETTTRL